MEEIGYVVDETWDQVPGIEPALVTRFFWRAERRCQKKNLRKGVPFYRWEIVREDARWKVLAYQNKMRPIRKGDLP